MDRRSFLTTSAAAGAMLATTRGATAETEGPAGNTSVPLNPTGEGRLPQDQGGNENEGPDRARAPRLLRRRKVIPVTLS